MKMKKSEGARSFGHKVFGTVRGEGMQPKEAMAYSVAGFGQNLVCTMIGSYLMVFMTDALGFDIDTKIGAMTGVMAVAWLMLGTRLFDAFNDPIMGSIVDRTRTKWGKCRPYLLWMPVPIGLVTILCFLPWYPNTAGGFAAISVIYILWSVVYTIVDVPFWGLSTCLTNDTIVRGKLLTVARLICTLAIGLVTIFVPIITSSLTAEYKYAAGTMIDGRDAGGLLNPEYAAQNAQVLRMTYFIIAVVLVTLSIPMFYYGFKNTRERFTAGENETPPTLRHNLGLLFKNKQLLLIVLSGILGGARMVYTYTGGLYFCKYALGNEAAYSTLTLLVIPGGLVASVLCPWLTNKIGKKWSFIGSHVIGAIAMTVMFFMWDLGTATFIKGGLAVCVVCLILVGIPQGINNIMTYAMIGDTVDYLEWKTGERGEGICFAMQTLINKIGMAIGAFVGVLAFGMAGISSADPAGSMTAAGLNKLWMMLVLTGLFSFIACIIPMFFYNITEKRQAEMVGEIAEKKAAAEAQAL